MKSLRIIAFCCTVSLLLSCGSSSSGEPYDLKGYTVEYIGGDASYAYFNDQNHWPLSSGHVINSVRNGTWMTYYPSSIKIKTITNYINGMKNGDEITMSERGVIESVKGYRNNELHGLSTMYKNSRALSKTTYAQGKMDGPFEIFDDSNGKIQRSGSFKNGLQHGELLYYDQDGNITLKYVYEHGEKVSGGIVE